MMKSSFSYRGKVTLKTFYKGIEMETFVFNEGMPLLFNMLAKALVGQNITNLLPTYIDIKSGTNSILRAPAQVVPLLVDSNKNNILNARMSATITENMLNNSTKYPTLTLELQTKNREVLASVSLQDNDSNVLNNLTSGTQLVVVWDLSIDNEKGGSN